MIATDILRLESVRTSGAASVSSMDNLRGAAFPQGHLDLLRLSDGLTAYGGYYRLFSVAYLHDWNLLERWRFAWPVAIEDYVFFGETAWGDQYAYSRDGLLRGDERIFMFDSVMMQGEVIAGSFERFLEDEFLRNALSPYDEFVIAARRELGDLLVDEHVVRVPSVLISGDERHGDIIKMPSAAAMIVAGDLAAQLGDEPQDKGLGGLETYVDEFGRTRVRVIWEHSPGGG